MVTTRGGKRRLSVRWLTALASVCGAHCGAAEQSAQRPLFVAPRGGVFQAPLAMVTTTDDDLLPTMTPGKNAIVYAAKASGNLDIYIRDLSTSGALRITTHSTDDTDPAFSPDGTRIAWVSQSGDVKGDIWVMNPDGSDKTQLTDRTTTDRAPAWSADGERIFFGTRPRGAGAERIDVIDLTTGERATVVENGWDPTVSPAGNVLFYSALDDRPQPRIYARDLVSGRAAVITDGAYVEGMARATQINGRVQVLFTRFVDDLSGDGTADAEDAPSVWAVDFDPRVFDGEPPSPARPLTAGDGGEIFAAPIDNWLVYTAAGFADLDIYALPITGMVNAEAGPEAVLEAARAEDQPQLRRLALRYLVATTPALEGEARYELARGLGERNAFSDAIEEQRRVVEVAAGQELGTLAALEVARLEMLEHLKGTLIVREESGRAFVNQRLAVVEKIAAAQLDSRAVQTRAASIRAEADYALGARQRAVSVFETIAAEPDGLPEDGARALSRLGEIYAELRDLSAVERVTVRLLRRFGSERYLAEQAAERWVQLATDSQAVRPLAALEQITREFADLGVVAARAARAQALIMTRLNDVESAIEQWRYIADHFASERRVLAEALTTLADTYARQQRGEETLDIFERILAEFPEDTQLRARARQGITRMALVGARQDEIRARRHPDPVAQRGLLEKARQTYQRLLRNNPELVIAHRRFIALSAELGHIRRVALAYGAEARRQPRDKYTRYGYAYALVYLQPTPLYRAKDELEAVLALDPRFAAAHLSLGWVQEQLELIEPGEGWLEKAADSANLVVRLLKPMGEIEPDAPDAALAAAAELNKGNALFKLGITDAALLAYLERERSGVPFDSPLGESLFRESFARVALSEDAFDVALDQAYAAHRLTTRRQGATAALIAALNLQVASAEPNPKMARSRFAEANEWYDVAIESYTGQHAWSRVVPMLRGKNLALRGLGLYEEALTVITELLMTLKRTMGAVAPEPPGITGIYVQELASDANNVTRAKYGFDADQEAELARTAAARIYRRWGNSHMELTFAEQRLALLRSEVEDPDTGERIRREYLAAIHETALIHVRAGSIREALSLWQEALALAGDLGRWQDAIVILEAVQTIQLTARLEPWPAAITAAAEKTARTATANIKNDATVTKKRFERWLSLEYLRRSLAPPVGEVKAATAAGFSTLLAHLDGAESAAAKAHRFARHSDRATLEARIARFRGVAAEGLELDAPKEKGDIDVASTASVGGEAGKTQRPLPPRVEADGSEPAPDEPAGRAAGWRTIFDRALAEKEPGERASAANLAAAIDAFFTDPTPPQAPERGLFLALATRALIEANEIERAWRLLERDRLLGLQPAPDRLGDGELADAWKKLRAKRGTADYQAAVAEAGSLVSALEGHPLAPKTVQAALEGEALLVQLFAPTPTSWHWFLISPRKIVHHETGPHRDGTLPDFLVETIGSNEAPSYATLYCDFGELIAGPADALQLGGARLAEISEVVEVLSGTYLVAAFARRNLARKGRATIGARGAGFQIEVPPPEKPPVIDPERPILDQVPPGRRLLMFDFPVRGESQGGSRPGLRQVLFGPGMPRTSQIDLDRIAAARLTANVVVLDAPLVEPSVVRSLAQAFLIAGIPSLAVRAPGAAQIGAALRDRLLEELPKRRLSAVVRDLPGRPLRMVGYRGMDYAARVDFVVDRYLDQARGAAAIYNEAKNRPRDQAHASWVEARNGFATIVDFIDFLDHPDALEALKASKLKLASQLPRLLPAHQIMMGNFLAQSHQALGEFEQAAAVQQVLLGVQAAAGRKKEVAELLLELAKTFANAKHLDRSKEMFIRCAKVATEIGETLTAADCNSRLGSIKRDLFDYIGAKESYEQAIAAYTSKGAKNVTYPMRYLGYLYETALNDYPKALETFNQALAAAEKHGLDDQIPVLLISIARVHRNRGDYERALVEVEKAVAVGAAAAPVAVDKLVSTRAAAKEAERASTHALAAAEEAKEALENVAPEERASAQASARDLDKNAAAAERTAERFRIELGLAVNEVRRLAAERSEAELEAARIYWYRGNYARATARQKQSLELANQARNDYLVIQAFSLAGLIALNQGDLEQAEASIRDALRLSRNTGRKSEEAIQLNNLGIILRSAGRLDEAISVLEQALGIDESLGSSEGRAFDLRNLAIAQNRKGDRAAALANVERSLELSVAIGNRFNQLHCLQARGDILEATDADEAAESYRAAAALALEMAVPEVEWTALYALGRLAEQAGEISPARARFEAALKVAERLGRGRSESTEAHSRKDLYGDAIRLAIGDGDLGVAFNYTERARARGFLDVLASTPLEMPAARAKDLLAAELETREARVNAERDVALEIEGAGERLASATEAHAAAVAALMADFPRLGRILTISPVAVAALQAALPKEVVVLSFFTGREKTRLLVVTGDNLRSVEIDLAERALREQVGDLRRRLRAFFPVEGELAALGQSLLEPARAELEAARVLVILPDGPLHNVPFNALAFDGTILIERFIVAQASSGSILYDQLIREPAPRPVRVIAYAPADDLPFARLEALELSGAEARLGARATESRFVEEDKGAGRREAALDIAAHGELDARNPMASALLFARGAQDDARLEVREVFGLRNVPPLVTLSACETTGALVDGLEWVGLGNAFLTAGARSVIATQNRVSDLAAAVLIKRFHRFARDRSAGEALRQAALWTRQYFRHPVHWGSFSLLGDFR